MSTGAVIGSVAIAAASTAVLTRFAIAYARHRALIDVPGRRRSHRAATLRGGGIAIVICVIAALLVLGTRGSIPLTPILWTIASVAAVAMIGWLDDHQSQPVSLRLVVHAAAALALAPQLGDEAGSGTVAAFVMLALNVLLLVSAVNVWNFMDGINGLVTSQSAWAAAAVALLLGSQGEITWTLAAAALFGACLGFLPFNFPRARIFLGDVGSGALGLICMALLLFAVQTRALDLWQAAMIVSALWIDASLTLASRVLSGRRWYTAHREHLYQWLVRSGRSHARVTLLYLSWNAIVVLPGLALAQHRPDSTWQLSMAVYAFGALLWFAGKRSVLSRARRRGPR